MNNASLHDLIVDIHALDRELRQFEDKFSLLSDDFYALYEAGRLRDEAVEEADEYGRWAALYRMRLRRKEQYDRLKTDIIKSEPVASDVVLKPYTVPNTT